MGIYQDCPFEHHNPDEPEEDRDRAVTPERDIVTICVNKAFDILIRTAARISPGGFFCGRNRLQVGFDSCQIVVKN